MARVFGVIIDDNYRVEYGLTKIYGIGWSRARQIINDLKIDEKKRLKDLSEEELRQLNNYLRENYKLEGELREEIKNNIDRLKQIRSYRGLRHMQGLPVRGQRTRSNARTKRGKRRTVSTFTKEMWAKIEQIEKQKKNKLI
ncbi:MAG: 30S ribosomal protein S13 [Patescibacteria group bacterium]|nr:MAG: 30S ribosomal protein S13 [Patescibacteria group bacterium]